MSKNKMSATVKEWIRDERKELKANAKYLAPLYIVGAEQTLRRLEDYLSIMKARTDVHKDKT